MTGKSTFEQQLKSLKRRLTFKYVLAFSLIAATLLFTFVVLQTHIREGEKQGYIINISGMQRMLSQRIALMSREVYHLQNPANAEVFTKKMRAAVEKMRDNHTQLISGNLHGYGAYEKSQAIKDAYFGEPQLDKHVTNYIDLAEQFLKEYDAGGIPAIQTSDTMLKIVAIARNGLLAELNDAVFIYQADAERDVKKLLKIEILVVIMGLSLLLMEALLIFRPMVRKVSENIEELQAYNNELIEFSYRISHDLRAPIVSSLGLARASKTALKSDQKVIVEKSLEHIETSMIRLNDLISDLINLTKVKLVDIKPEPTDCKELVEIILEKLSSLENYDAITIRKHVEIDRPINIKKILLQQNLENLISNSIKYADFTKENAYINIVIQQKADKIIVDISDNGLGIPEEYRDRMFEMFERFHPEQSFGSGLGLYLVYQNAKALRGDITYTRTDDGSLFEMIFPEDV